MQPAAVPTPLPAFRSLYIHFPFCEVKCHYCDFYSLGAEKTKKDDPRLFEQALIQEIKLYGEQGAFAPMLETLFLGGGTPSMTPPESMARVFDKLFQYTSIDSQTTEWTMEANPSSITLKNFKAYHALGVNRVSMGTQSLNDEHLKLLGRVHDSQTAYTALHAVFEAGFKNVSTDFICGIPNQTLKDLEFNLEQILKFPITHLSCYLLTLPKHHKMYSSLPNEDEQLEHLLFVDQFLASHGFDHYEISNFAKIPPHNTPPIHAHMNRAHHNLVYWKNKPYLGLGPSAHSFTGNARFKNYSSLHAYGRGLSSSPNEPSPNEAVLPIEWVEALNAQQTDLEKWMLAIRLSEGFPESWLKTDAQKNWAKTFVAEGLLKSHPHIPQTLTATPRGFALSDTLVKKLT